MSREYNPDIRENDPLYLRRQSQELIMIANARKSASPIIYACLDLRIALEIIDMNIVLTSVEPAERQKIFEDCKPKNGIDRNGKKVGVLKEKYQTFFQAVCETVGVNAQSFDFKKSKELQYELSTYIHSYYLSNSELNYNSSIMQSALQTVSEVQKFIISSLAIDNDQASIVGIEISSLPEHDKQVLEEWKASKITYEELKYKLSNKNKS